MSAPNNNATSADAAEGFVDAVDGLLQHSPGIELPPPAAALNSAVDGAPGEVVVGGFLPPPTPLHRSNRNATTTSNDNGDNDAVPLQEMATAILLAPNEAEQVGGDSVVENQAETVDVKVQVHSDVPPLPPPETADAVITTADPVAEAVVGIDMNATEKRGSEQVAAEEGGQPEGEPVAKKLKLEDETSAAPAASSGGSTQQTATNSTPAPVGRKERLEFTAAEKLHILSLIESNQNRTNTSSMNPARTTTGDDKEESQQPMTAKQIRAKYNVSKSSLHRWKQQKSRLQALVDQGAGMGDRKRDTRDLTLKLKVELKKFAEENATKDAAEKLAITTPLIMAKAVLIQEEMIKSYEEAGKPGTAGDGGDGLAQEESGESNTNNNNKPLTEEEYNAIKEFKVTKSWAGRVGSSMGLLSYPRPRAQRKKEKSTVLPKAELAPAEAMGWATGSQPQTAEQAKANTENFLSQTNPDHGVSKPKKDRREFTALEKRQILEEMDEKKMKMEEVCAKWHTSKSSVFRWKIQRKNGQLNAMINDEKGGHSKRIVEDRLLKIKLELKKFVDANNALPVNEQIPINGNLLQMKASEARDELLLRHDQGLPDDLLTDDEAIALQNFKASKGWARKVAERYGWKIANRRDDSMIDVGAGFLMERPNLVNNAGVESVALDAIKKNTFDEATPHNVPPPLGVLPPILNGPAVSSIAINPESVDHDVKNEMNDHALPMTIHKPPPIDDQMPVDARAAGGVDPSSLHPLPPIHPPHVGEQSNQANNSFYADQEPTNEQQELVNSVMDTITL